MTENDYIAEYIKERHPGDLGFDFAVWKCSRKIMEVGKALVEVFTSTEFKEANKAEIESQESEVRNERDSN